MTFHLEGILDRLLHKTDREAIQKCPSLRYTQSERFCLSLKKPKQEEANMGSIAKKGMQNYLTQLQQHPLRTKAITAGVLSAVSDIVSQKLTGIQKLQLRRLLLKVLLGAAYLGPFGHFLHIILDKIFKGNKDPKTVAKKVVVEQLTASPWNNLVFMLYYGLAIERTSWTNMKAKIKKDYPSLQVTSWTFWPVVGWINHQYVPLQFRVIFHMFVGFGWGIFLSLQARTMALTKRS